MRGKKGFSLIELVITLGIVAVISTVAIIVLGPAELMRQARDGKRFNDLNTLAKAVALYESEGFSLGQEKIVYYSIPDLNATTTAGTYGTCNVFGPTWKCHYPASSSLRKINGTGWIPINFNQLSITPPISQLPVDPINSTGTPYAFAVASGTWKLFSNLESVKYFTKWATDGGVYPCAYETGDTLSLDIYEGDIIAGWPVASTWDLAFRQLLVDCGPRGLNGQLGSSLLTDSADPTWDVTGAGSLSFDGGDYVIIGTNSRDAAEGSDLSVEAWVRLDVTASSMAIVTKNVIGDLQWSLWHNASNNFLFSVRNSGGTSVTATSDSSAYVAGVWYHVVGVYDGSAVRLYVNGAAADSTPPSLSGTIMDRQHLIVIGGDYVSSTTSGAPSFRGDLDSVTIWDRGLSASEVLSQYNAGIN